MANIIPYREFLKRKELREQETGIPVRLAETYRHMGLQSRTCSRMGGYGSW